ncbi:MAG TPA: universal stress protein, partial [Thermomicrobiales bacterium]|nr:universal stress protein [Thermomicrobiales bacterium]
ARALGPARDYARAHKLPIKLVRAVDPPLVNQVSTFGTRPVYMGTDTAYQEGDQEAHDYLNRLVDHLRADGYEASGIVVWGKAASAVADSFAPGDLVVMSSHGHTGARRWFLGSVAEDILKRTSNTVLLVRDDT